MKRAPFLEARLEREMIPSSTPKTALVHHWLVTRRGGEQVLEALLELFPDADVFTLVADREQFPDLCHRNRVHTSFVQRLPAATRLYRFYLPLFPWATERLDLSGYDRVISSDAATLKGVRTSPKAEHFCYCYTPMRYVWDGYETYYGASGPLGRLALSAIRGRLRRWDWSAAQRVTHFVAISRNVQRRIHDCYGRESGVIYPPVDTEKFVEAHPSQGRDGFYLHVSQLVSYKRADLIVEAFNQCRQPLVIIGDGPERRKLERAAKPNIRFLGSQPRSVVIEAMQRCRAFVFAGEEDFGIVMAEAQACGTPVIAFGKGGALEIVTDGVTGILFGEQTAASLLDALARFRPDGFDPSTIRASALRFRRERFLQEFGGLTNRKAMALGNSELNCQHLAKTS